MIEAEWLACTDPDAMMVFLWERVGKQERKPALFAAACCRRVWPLLSDPRSWNLIEVFEQQADGLASVQELWNAQDAVRDQRDEVLGWGAGVTSLLAQLSDYWEPTTFAHLTKEAGEAIATVSNDVVDWDSSVWMAALALERKYQVRLMRELFGNPFRPVSLEPAWRTPAVVALAQAAYNERAFPSGHLDPDRLAILADALEGAGCTDADILNHCRGPGPHVRGCWVLDLLLGKS
jgi:hypothetical protein